MDVKCLPYLREASENSVVWVREWAEERGLDIGAATEALERARWLGFRGDAPAPTLPKVAAPH